MAGLVKVASPSLSSTASWASLHQRAIPPSGISRWPQRYTVVALFFLGTALCYIDRISISVAIIPLARQFGYDSAAQGLVLSAVFWGYLWTQLVGGWMADRFGGHRVLAAGVAIWSLATFVTPLAAAATFSALLAARVLLGLGEGVNFPSIHSLTSRWTLPSERARVLSVNYSGMYVGTVAALSASPLIIKAFGWPALFYISGALGAVWVAVWMYLAADRPETSIAHQRRRTRIDHVVAHGRAARDPGAVGGNRARESGMGDRRRAFLQQLRIQHPAALDADLSASHLQRAAGTRRRVFDHSVDRDVLHDNFLGLAGRYPYRARPRASAPCASRCRARHLRSARYRCWSCPQRVRRRWRSHC